MLEWHRNTNEDLGIPIDTPVFAVIWGLFNRITIEKKAEAVLTDLNVVGPLRVGDCISFSAEQPPVVSAASGEPRGVLLTTKGSGEGMSNLKECHMCYW